VDAFILDRFVTLPIFCSFLKSFKYHKLPAYLLTWEEFFKFVDGCVATLPDFYDAQPEDYAEATGWLLTPTRGVVLWKFELIDYVGGV
jgi:hypothetical protein